MESEAITDSTYDSVTLYMFGLVKKYIQKMERYGQSHLLLAVLQLQARPPACSCTPKPFDDPG